MRVEDTLGLACKALGARSGPDNARPLYLHLELYFRNILSRLRHTRGMTEASLQSHIQENDYFGTLATVLDLVSQDLRKKGHHRNADTLGHLRDDLVYLQQSHRIEAIRKNQEVGIGASR